MVSLVDSLSLRSSVFYAQDAAVRQALTLTSLLDLDSRLANILPKSSSASLMERLESSSLGGVAVVTLLEVIARSLVVVIVPRRLLSDGTGGGKSLFSLLALLLIPKENVRPACLRKFPLATLEGGAGKGCDSS